jgi:voltage-gated potassium channel
MPVARAAERSTRWSRATDRPLLVAAVAFLVVLLVPLYRPDLPDEVLEALRVANVALWLVFGVDYAVRLLLAPERRAYVRGHRADLATLAVPFLRPLRLLRLVRVAGLLGTATRRASGRALLTTTGTVVVGELVLVVVAGGLVLDAERGVDGANITSAADALWWSATTVTTVGYGDRFPVTGEGRLVAVGLMVAGIALLGVVSASVAAWFVRRFTALEQLEVDVERDAAATAATLAELSDRLKRIERHLERLTTEGGRRLPGA